jgi:hypothetical protein
MIEERYFFERYKKWLAARGLESDIPLERFNEIMARRGGKLESVRLPDGITRKVWGGVGLKDGTIFGEGTVPPGGGSDVNP